MKPKPQRRVWTPYSAARRYNELMEAAAHGASPAMLREIGELSLLLRAPALATA